MTTADHVPSPWFASALTGARGAGTVRVLSRDEVTRCAGRFDVLDTVRSTLVAHDQGRCTLPGEAYLPWRNSAGAYTRSIAMPGAVSDGDGPGRYGLKIINASVSNPSVGLERAGGVGLCFDAETARVTAIIEMGLLSAIRTAAVSAVGVEAIGQRQPGSLAIVGCGMQGRMHASLLLERLPSVRRLALFDQRPGAAEGVTGMRPDVRVRVADSVRSAVADSDLVVLTTTADEGYLPPEWIAPGALVVNVSLADLTDEALTGAAALYVDDVELIRENPRRPLGRLLAAGVIGEPGSAGGAVRRIDGTIGGLLTGRYRPVEPAGDSYTVLNPFGMGVLDVALLHEVRRVAMADGIGTDVLLG